MGFKTVFEDCDILVVGGGMGGTGAAYEARYWGRDLKIVVAEKANIDRSGAVAQGLYAINCYMGMRWGENQPEDHVRYARNDLMGMVREDLPTTWPATWTPRCTSSRSGACPSCATRRPGATSAKASGRS
jgi:glycine/D-amino acid oxidase-like deaminating enzyme